MYSIIIVIECVPEIWIIPAQTCHFGGLNSGFPGTQLSLN